MNDWDDNEMLDGGALGARLDDDFGLAIGAALGDLRVNPEDFAAGVAKRIEEGERKIRKSGPGRVLSIAWLRQAASFLPPFLVPRALAEAGLTFGGVAVKKGAWTWLPAVLALPVLLFSMLIASFVWGVRRVGDVRDQGVVEDLAGYQVRQWWKEHRLVSVGSQVALLYFGAMAPLEAVTFFVMLAIVAQLGVFKSLASIGLASRAEIGQRCGEYLFFVVIWTFLMMTAWVPVGDGLIVRASLVFLPVVGGAVCLRLGSLDRLGWSLRHKQRVLLPVLASTVFGLWILVFAGSTRATRIDAVDYVEQGFLEEEHFGWQVKTIAATYEHLSAAGTGAPDLRAFRERLSGHLQELRDLNPERDNNYRGVAESAVLGWLTPEDIALFQDERRQERLTAYKHPLLSLGDVYMAVRNRMQEGSLSATERGRIAERIVAGVQENPNPLSGWPGAERAVSIRVPGAREDGNPVSVWWAVQILEALELPTRVEQLREVAQVVLRDTWTGTAGSSAGCFAPYASAVERTSYGAPLPDQAPLRWLGSSDRALRLMARFGVPSEVDLDAFAAFLDEARVHPRFAHRMQGSVLAAAMREHVAQLGGTSPQQDQPTLWTQLAELRAVLAVLLLVVFCIVLTARAPMTAIEDC